MVLAHTVELLDVSIRGLRVEDLVTPENVR
jgi:hypothetical protein